MKYPCAFCKKQCRTNVIECVKCKQWVHAKCVQMDESLLKSWNEKGLDFICSQCAFTASNSPEYNIKAALNRYDFQKDFTFY